MNEVTVSKRISISQTEAKFHGNPSVSMVRMSMFEERSSLFASFVKLVGKCNQVIYEEAIVELCCPPDREGFDDNSVTHSDTTASDSTVSDLTASETLWDKSLGKCNQYKDAHKVIVINLLASLTAMLGADGEWSFGRSMSMGRGKDKELTSRGSSQMRRKRTSVPSRTKSPKRAVSPRQAVNSQRQPFSTSRYSRIPKREDSGKKKLQDDSLATSHRKEAPPATFKATRAFSTLRTSAGSKSSMNKSKARRSKTK
jgi:hypothetical protein